jgi:O-succinylbenzoic acid--CoA ligase
LSQTDDGCLIIDAPVVHDGPLVTNDIVEFNTSPGISSSPYKDVLSFRILGRKDNVICSGGVKIQAEEVERLLCARLREPYLISKCHDPKFGEAVVLLTEGDTASAKDVCESVLQPYLRPKAYVSVSQIPLTETGKPARRQAELLAKG